MTSPEALYMKHAVNEHSLLLVTHMTHFDICFGCYGILKLGFSAGQILNGLGIPVLDQVSGP
jgi:hypothetical protein